MFGFSVAALQGIRCFPTSRGVETTTCMAETARGKASSTPRSGRRKLVEHGRVSPMVLPRVFLEVFFDVLLGADALAPYVGRLRPVTQPSCESFSTKRQRSDRITEVLGQDGLGPWDGRRRDKRPPIEALGSWPKPSRHGQKRKWQAVAACRSRCAGPAGPPFFGTSASVSPRRARGRGQSHAASTPSWTAPRRIGGEGRKAKPKSTAVR